MRHALLLVLCGSMMGCEDPPGLTEAEARAALDQVVLSTVGQATLGPMIELATGFELGVPVADAATELTGLIGTAAPCAGPTVADATISMTFAGCAYEGHTYSGASTVTVLANETTSVEVAHAWTGLADEAATVDGTTAVEWSGEGMGLTRHVVHDLTWSTPDGAAVESTEDHLQALMRPGEGLAGGVVVNGTREWTVGGEVWSAVVNDVELYNADLVPEDGSYTLLAPTGREYDVAFDALEGDVISVVVDEALGRWTLEVDRRGQPIATE
jgi:hypothetical protein